MTDAGQAAVTAHFDDQAAASERWRRRNGYYHEATVAAVREFVPPGRRVVEVGCGLGDVLASLAPSCGVGIDASPALVARAQARHPSLRFVVGDVTTEGWSGRFDHVVAVDVFEHTLDLDAVLQSVAGLLATGGTAVATTPNPLWAGPLWLAERLGRKMPEGPHRWRSLKEIERAARRVGLSAVSAERRMLLPFSAASRAPARLGHFPLVDRLRARAGLLQVVVLARAQAKDGRNGNPDEPPAGRRTASSW